MRIRAVSVLFVLATSTALASTAFAADVKADYQFQNTLSSSVAGAPDLVPLGTGSAAFATETVAGQNRTVYTFNTDGTAGAGLQAQTNGLISDSTYSIVFYARLTFTENFISKIIDFKNLSSDAGLYTVSNVPTFYDALAPVGFGPTPFPLNDYGQLALTRDASGTVSVYLDGAPSFSFDDSTTNLATIDDPNSANEFLNFFFDDPNSTIITTGLTVENPSGAIARLRLYDGALTADEVANLDTVPEPATAWAAALAVCLLRNRGRRGV